MEQGIYPDVRRRRAFINRILDIEGGYVDNPDDPGGETNMGISRRSYPGEDIKNLLPSRATMIYVRDFYEPLRIDGIKDEAVVWALFDMGVNSGVAVTARRLQMAVNHVTGAALDVDGRIGPLTLDALNRARADILLVVLAAYRIMLHVAIVKKRPGTRQFVPGWTRRTRQTIV